MKKAIEKPFYFMFSYGEYSDYGVGGIYVCDHRVTKDEWHAHYRAYQDQLSAMGPQEEQSWDEWHDAGGYEKREQWLHQNDPEATFQKLHRMTQLEVVELWRDA